MMTGVDLLLSRLQRVRAVGPGQWAASCPLPGHGKGLGDRDPSLSITNGNGSGIGSGIGIYCHVCGKVGDEVVAEVGLTWPELHTKQETLAPRIVATYDYCDETENFLYQIVRFVPKDFRQRRPDPSDPNKWTWNLKEVRRVLYNLPDVKKAIANGETVFVVEGEKDVDNLRKIGITATCNVGGAGKWRAEYSESLRGGNVVIIPDNDGPGRKHADNIAHLLVAVAATVKVVTLPGPGKDVSDWIAGGGTREELERLAKVQIEDEPVPIFTRCAADIKPVPIEWIWENRLAAGKLTMLASDPGLGKSLITVIVAATVSSSGRWPAGEGNCEAGEVLLASYEDDPADTVVPRLQAAGADLTKVHFLEKVPSDQGPRHFDVARDWERLDKLLTMRTGVRLLVVDPISAAMSGVDTHRNSEVREALTGLVGVAQRHGVAVLAVSHFSKGSGGKALHKVIGSIAFTAAARIAFIAARDEDDPTGDRHLFLPIKSNIGDDRVGIAYRKRGVTLPSGIEAWRIEWGERVSIKADEVMAPPDEDGGAMAEAKRFLLSTLEAGPAAVEMVRDKARRAGISDITLRRAKGKLKISAQDRDDNGVRGQWMWRLPSVKPGPARGWEEV